MYGEDRTLGIALPVAGAVSLVGGLFGGDSKDPNRIATNSRAYTQAISGNDGPFEGFSSALEFLRVHSVMGDADGGWATKAATDDAMKKYQQALSVINSQRGATAGAPVASGGVTHLPSSLGGAMPGLLLAGAAVVGVAVLLKNRR